MGMWTQYGVHRVQVAPSSVPLVTTEEIKAHLRIDHDAEDALLDGFVAAATQQCETFSGRAFLSATWDLILPGFPPGGRIFLFPYPFGSVDSIAYWADETEETLDAEEYREVLGEVAGLIERTGDYWPETDDRADAVKVRYTAGYGDTAADVPERYKNAVKIQAGNLYKNRDEAEAKAELPGVVICLLGRQIEDFN